MITNYLSQHSRLIAFFCLTTIYAETVLANRAFIRQPLPYIARGPGHGEVKVVAAPQVIQPMPLTDQAGLPREIRHSDPAPKKVDIGPEQPEMSAFTSVGSNNMVDLFSGDFSYNIPLMDVGGYPINLAYRGGVSMDQEASWVGLGWNINPGTITRNLRGLPDDFTGKADSIRKVNSIRPNTTIGVNVGSTMELLGLPGNLKVGAGLFYNNYKGWGVEKSLNLSLSSATASKGGLTAGLSISNNTQEGISISPSMGVTLHAKMSDDINLGGSMSVTAPYNSRSGLKALQLSTGVRASIKDKDIQGKIDNSGPSAGISFAFPAYTPTINLPYTSQQYSYSVKAGVENSSLFQGGNVSGYFSQQKIADADTALSLPAYGYLNFADGAGNASALLDFNREKDIPFRDKPAVPHIAIPQYTYDAFSITGEGTGGMFRAYRGDIGFVFDHAMRTKDLSDNLSTDAGIGDILHLGVNYTKNRAYTESGAWLSENPSADLLRFRQNKAAFEGVYFRNPGERSINTKSFYEGLGGDQVVTLNLYQPNIHSPSISATNYLRVYQNKKFSHTLPLNEQTVVKAERDKRTQVISYLNAQEASEVGFNKYIESYTSNNFSFSNCPTYPSENESTNGLLADYFANKSCSGTPAVSAVTAGINFNWGTAAPTSGIPSDQFSIRWTGRVKAPITGRVIFIIDNLDDGVRLWINDSLLINSWKDQHAAFVQGFVDLVKDENYKIRVEYFDSNVDAALTLKWRYTDLSGTHEVIIPSSSLFPPDNQQTFSSGNLTQEKRINTYRKSSHISEIDVLNGDGRRYIYGIPVYNLKQKEVTFSVNGKDRGNTSTGLVGYTHGTDNTTGNTQGKEFYYSSEEVPAYAHSFLLTSILSPDYADVTGNGLSDDDLGDAVKFNYSRVCSLANPFRWRAPYVADSATYNEGLKTDERDDKGSYVYGEKELWFLHSIESKTMVATFLLQERKDLLEINEQGSKQNNGKAKCLKEINLYSKADFLKNGTNARPIKTVHFEYSYQLCRGMYKNLNDSGKLTLTRIWFTFNGSKKKAPQNAYNFTYSNLNPTYNSKSYDRWGNYKDPMQNPGSTSTRVITNSEYPYALQDSVDAAKNAGAWALERIGLPSGGAIKVTYESDDYAYVQDKRASQFFKIAGFSTSYKETNPQPFLYKAGGDMLYVFVKLSEPVANPMELYHKYLEGIDKLYFRMYVNMPFSSGFGEGKEYISCYAEFDKQTGFGLSGTQMAWIRLKGISIKGDDSGNYSPLAKASLSFLRLNLPSKAYPGSEPGPTINGQEAIAMILTLASPAFVAFMSFDEKARMVEWANKVDTSRTWVRLNAPTYKKYGGGHRVKRIVVEDNWDKMTGQPAARYGQEYTYTTEKEIQGVMTRISSGVAVYEPALGGEENPFHQPVEYIEKISVMGPVALGYSEEPLGESMFPSAGVGYSKVRVRTINYQKAKSANGFSESCFYTAYDFPTFTDHSLLDADTKLRYKPGLRNFLKIDAKNFITVSQGFKVELNDMHGKMRSEAYFAETDPKKPITYTENFYRVEDPLSEHKKLANTVWVMKSDGTIDTTALIGKDVELMMDMRQEYSVSQSLDNNLNVDMFNIPTPAGPVPFAIPSFYMFPQKEVNQFRSAATLKVIQRYGILDSVLHIDKGSKVTTRDLLYDSETGSVLLNQTKNEFNDLIYSFNFPAHWAYDGMGLAYKNIDVTLSNLLIKGGKVVSGLPVSMDTYFSHGDEMLVWGNVKTGDGITTCNDIYATFPKANKVWAINKNEGTSGATDLYLIDKEGKPFSGFVSKLHIFRSGRRNVNASIGSVTTLVNPLVLGTGGYSLQLNTNSKVVATGAAEFSDHWFNDQTCASCQGTVSGGQCITETAPEGGDEVSICRFTRGNISYSSCGTWIYSRYDSSYQPFSRARLAPSNSLWVNSDDSHECLYTPVAESENLVAPEFSHDTTCSSTESTGGPFNRCAVWICPSNNNLPLNEWVSVTTQVNIPSDGNYFIGMASDNRMKVYIDGVLFKEDDQYLYATSGSDEYFNPENYKMWHMYPKYLSSGIHYLKFMVYNGGCDAAFGLEIYGNDEKDLTDATSFEDLNIVFSTKDMDGLSFSADYVCPDGFQLQFISGSPTCIKTEATIAFDNPLTKGIFGSWRPTKSYVYYTSRAEVDPASVTNIRRNGTYADYAPFWAFSSGKLLPQYNAAKWVWNSEVNQYNKKGVEVENRDPLGRYNSGQYGYHLNLPVAVSQNSKARESGYEGFEDYESGTESVCDNSCKDTRHVDFSAYATSITQEEKHTGKSSLKLYSFATAQLTTSLMDSTADRTKPIMTVNTTTNACWSGINLMTGISYTHDGEFTQLAPSKGKKMVISAWVKEQQSCTCSTYVNNQINIGFTGSSTTYIFKPSGPIIDGWQRYEGVFEIPASASGMITQLKATGSTNVYFDDVRLHPFNANMKSFAYHPINLRLMAELDENNYATFYEYDDEGTLIRVKKETERGIKTIKETRSALLKEN
jgi:hypothetical protein